jgi:hypothetical protein
MLEAITANSSTPYIAAYTDLRKGPVVLEIPPAGTDGSLYGQVVDAWQLTIADVGPAGLDAGKGGKYLFTAPGYTGKVPAGYLHIESPNYRIAFAFRSVKGLLGVAKCSGPDRGIGDWTQMDPNRAEGEKAQGSS